jgi:hypothetical protein
MVLSSTINYRHTEWRPRTFYGEISTRLQYDFDIKIQYFLWRSSSIETIFLRNFFVSYNMYSADISNSPSDTISKTFSNEIASEPLNEIFWVKLSLFNL